MRELAGRTLGPRWFVARHDGEALVLQKHTSGEWRRAVASVLVGVGCVAGATGLFVITPDALALVFWPLAVGLVVVGALAALGAVRAALHALRGVTLEFAARTVRGRLVPRGLGFELGPAHSFSAEQVEAVLLHRVSHPPLTLSLLEVALRSGRRLQGPEVAFPPSEADPLEPVARAAAALLSRPLRVD
jgi:hypothetical protein